MLFLLVAEITTVSPSNASASLEYSRSGSITIISAFLSESKRLVSSCFAIIDLPEPETPVMNELPFRSSV